MYICMYDWVNLLYSRKLIEHCKPTIMEKIKIIFLKKEALKIELPYNPAIPLLDVYPPPLPTKQTPMLPSVCYSKPLPQWSLPWLPTGMGLFSFFFFAVELYEFVYYGDYTVSCIIWNCFLPFCKLSFLFLFFCFCFF